jgi:hypothetical protein
VRGTDRGKNGFYTINDSWFGQHVFEVAARKSALPTEQRALDAEPFVLPTWDPMIAWPWRRSRLKPGDLHEAMPSPVAFRLITGASVSSRNPASSASRKDLPYQAAVHTLAWVPSRTQARASSPVPSATAEGKAHSRRGFERVRE